MPHIPTLPTPHAEKMTALVANTKVPVVDMPRIQAAAQRYQQQIALLQELSDDT